MTKPLVFNFKWYEELRKAYKELLADNQKLMADNRDLRNQLEGAKVLIYQQKHLVRCMDCKYNADGNLCIMAGVFNGNGFCSKGERR